MIITSDPLSFYIIGILFAKAVSAVAVDVSFVERIDMISLAFRVWIAAVEGLDNVAAASDERALAWRHTFDFGSPLTLATALVLTIA